MEAQRPVAALEVAFAVINIANLSNWVTRLFDELECGIDAKGASLGAGDCAEATLSCDLPEHHSGHRCFSVPGGMGGELGLVLLKRTPLRLETQPPKPAIGALVISFP
jgi:hypothetical protein